MENSFKLDFIGIGAQKSATSWIYKCLLEHPEICGCSNKETHFFSRDKDFDKGFSFYKKYFIYCDPNKVIGEFSTSYLSDEKAFKRIKRYFPKVKIIVCLRNPIDRAFSHYLHLRSKGEINKQTTLFEAIKNYPEIIENGKYGKHLEKYFKEFSKEQILVLFYSDIKDNPENFIKKVYRFLNVDESFIAQGVNKKYNTSSARLCPLYMKINRIYLFIKNKKIGRLIIKIIKFFGITPYTIEGVMSKFSKAPNKISKEEIKYLYKIYFNDIKKLEKILNKDLSFWKME